MARPVVGTLAEEALVELEPYAHAEAELDWPLLTYLGALLDRAQEVADLARDSDDAPGWSPIGDPDRAPEHWLPWTAQLVGVVIPPPGSPEASGLDEAAKRLRIKETAGQRRGTPDAIKGAARQHLTGNRTTYISERHGSAYQLRVATLEAETPDPDLVLASLLEQKPGGIVLTYDVIPAGGDYDALNSTHANYDEVEGDFANYTEVVLDPAHT